MFRFMRFSKHYILFLLKFLQNYIAKTFNKNRNQVKKQRHNYETTFESVKVSDP